MHFLPRWFRRKPVNVLGPFVFPAPDDPRWVGMVVGSEICYTLDDLACHMYENLSWGGFIMIRADLLTELGRECRRLGRAENRYARAVHRAYRLAHPEQELRPRPRGSEVVRDCLDRINNPRVEK